MIIIKNHQEKALLSPTWVHPPVNQTDTPLIFQKLSLTKIKYPKNGEMNRQRQQTVLHVARRLFLV